MQNEFFRIALRDRPEPTNIASLQVYSEKIDGELNVLALCQALKCKLPNFRMLNKTKRVERFPPNLAKLMLREPDQDAEVTGILYALAAKHMQQTHKDIHSLFCFKGFRSLLNILCGR